MAGRHSEIELSAYVRGELSAAERDRVSTHLAACADCQRAADMFRTLLADLKGSARVPPAIDWERYRTELAAKIRQRTDRSLEAADQWWFRPVPLTCAASLAAILLFIAVQGGLMSRRPGDDLIVVEETLIGRHFALLQHLTLVERLDLLEDFDVIRHLDQGSVDGDG